ncbi:AMP-binding protein [Nocardia aurantia]|uniref:Long-chain-fatty-acid--CoA ligase n=1 Tax=Nocardia aurantia TaxID=2585199 RepID=A0A7K0E1X6_9NOCA|nr:AMP-binding protein [Nocardia aurantia]MQY31881.1 Long-chain-fatty-acid--CoA ligase [Nocardia aurantia]
MTTVSTALARRRTDAAAFGVLLRAGMLSLPPKAALISAKSVRRLGPLGGLPAGCAAAFGDRIAFRDDRGTLTYREFGSRTERFARLFTTVPAGDGRQPGIGILCRNHADAVVALCAAGAVGARVVLLNSDFGRRQIDEVAARERLDAIVYDDDFESALAGFDGITWCAWHSGPEPDNALARAAAAFPAGPLPSPRRPGIVVILTSGSSGTPKGAPRESPNPLLLPAGLLSRIPLRRNDRILLSAPVFHGWGLIVTTIALLLGAEVVLQRRFDAGRALDELSARRCTAFVAVPTMLRRVLALGDRLAAADLGALRIVGSGGARLDPEVVRQIFEAFGPVLHNLYGSTEASYISIATPADLLRAPDCAGRPALGIAVRIVTDDGRPVPPNTNGRILVRTSGQVTEYTDGSSRAMVDGFLDTGDRGHLDERGRLYVTGRSDGMIVSGGENVFPEEVELVLQRHPGVADAVVVPVADADFGQRLRAYLVAAGNDTGTDDLDIAEVRARLSAELPRSRMPRDIIVVTELPRGASGKVLRRTLEELERSHP